MRRLNYITGDKEEVPQKHIDFLRDIEDVCKKYGLCISHEDSHGSFLIEEYSETMVNWLKDAAINYDINNKQLVCDHVFVMPPDSFDQPYCKKCYKGS